MGKEKDIHKEDEKGTFWGKKVWREQCLMGERLINIVTFSRELKECDKQICLLDFMIKQMRKHIFSLIDTEHSTSVR